MNVIDVKDIADILDWLEEEVTEERHKKEKEGPNLHGDLLKEERKVKEKRDFINKSDLYEKLKRYKVLQFEKFKNEIKKEDEIEYSFLRKYLIKKYSQMATKLLNHGRFRFYQQADKDDMFQDAVLKALNIGMKGKSNYGREYLCRFNFDKHNNVFAFWTQMIIMFFFQYLNSGTEFSDMKQFVLRDMVANFESEWGLPFYFGDCVDSE